MFSKVTKTPTASLSLYALCRMWRCHLLPGTLCPPQPLPSTGACSPTSMNAHRGLPSTLFSSFPVALIHLQQNLKITVSWINHFYSPNVRTAFPITCHIAPKMNNFIKIKLEKNSLVPSFCDLFLEQSAWKSAFFVQILLNLFHPLRTIDSPTNLFISLI